MAKEFKTWEILKPGNYPEGIVTAEMIQDISSTFGSRGDIPIGIGHSNYFWRDDLPAEGYLRKSGGAGISKNGSFVAKGVELLAGLKESYEEGRYSKWSAVVGRNPTMGDDGQRTGKFSKWELFAVDVLGRTPPAIKGLRDLTGKNVEELKKYSIEFSEDNENAMIFSGQEFEIMSFSGDFTTDNNNDNEENDEMSAELLKKMEAMEIKLASFETEKKEVSGKMESLEAEKIRLSAELANSQAKVEETEKIYKAGQVELLEAATKTLPKEMKEKLFAAIEATAGSNISFSSGDKKTSLHSVFAECLNQVANVNSSDPTSEMNSEFSAAHVAEEKKAEEEGKVLLSSATEMVGIL